MSDAAMSDAAMGGTAVSCAAVRDSGPRVCGLLASVTSCAEAAIVLDGGADLVDLKDPARGALGALDPPLVRAVVRQVAGRVPVSATVGDLAAMQPRQLAEAAARMAGTGVDYVKVGVFPAVTGAACIDALAPLAAGGTRLIAVFFADLGFAPDLPQRCAAAGFAGVMVDTAEKASGSLRSCCSDRELGRFVAAAHADGLLAGLAGSLAIADIAPLLRLAPDYLGFRGALCSGGKRTAELDAAAFARVRAALRAEPILRITSLE